LFSLDPDANSVESSHPILHEMSLLYDADMKLRTTLMVLWRETRKAGAGEPESMSFWQHLIAKHEFSEEWWVCDAEMRPAPGSRKRIDRGVRFVDSSMQLTVLLWVEGKGNTSATAKKEAEEQALRACRDNLESHKSQTFIYALTTAMTEAKVWIYHRDEPNLQALHDEHYIEANSTQGSQLRVAFARMKKVTPGVVGGAPNPQVTSQGRITHTLPLRSVDPSLVLASDEQQIYAEPLFPRGVPTQVLGAGQLPPWASNQPQVSAHPHLPQGGPTRIPETIVREATQTGSRTSLNPSLGQREYSKVTPIVKLKNGRKHLYYQKGLEQIELVGPRRTQKDGRTALCFDGPKVYVFEDEVMH
jgi:hypothetical protein